MSCFGSTFGGSGFGNGWNQGGYPSEYAWFGWPLPSITMDTNQQGEIRKVKPEEPIDRSMSAWMGAYGGYGSYGYGGLGAAGWGMGAFPSFDPIPFSSPWLFWQMRKYPAVRLIFNVICKPILAGTRSIEIIDERGNKNLAQQMKEAAEHDLLPILDQAIEPAMESMIFGNWLQEMIWDRAEGRTVPIQANSVLPTEATLHCDPQRKFSGYQIGEQFRDPRYGFLCVNEPFIHPTLGFSRCENAKTDWWRASQSNMNADRIERKASGRQMMLSVPNQTFTDENGKPVMTREYVQTIINTAVVGGIFTVPLSMFKKEDIIREPKLADIPAIKVHEFDWGDTGPALLAHLARLDMSDRNIVRAFGRPERESTEGKHGTKAESGVHGAIGTTDSERLHSNVCQQWDAQILETWRITNYGKDSPLLKTMPAPLSDPEQEFLQEVTNTLLSDRMTGPDVAVQIDKPALLSRVEVPTLKGAELKKAITDQQELLSQNQQQGQQNNANPVAKGNGSGKIAMSADVEPLWKRRMRMAREAMAAT